MNRTLIRRSLLILGLVLASAFVIVRSPVHLGLDLRGGASLIVRVKVDDLPIAQRREVVEQTRQIIERRINAYGLSEAPVQPYGKLVMYVAERILEILDLGLATIKFLQLDLEILLISERLILKKSQCDGLAEQDRVVCVAAPVDTSMNSMAERDVVSELVQLAVQCHASLIHIGIGLQR